MSGSQGRNVWVVVARVRRGRTATVVLGIQGRRKSGQLEGAGRGLATAAIVMGALELAIAVFAVLALTSCVRARYHCR